MTVFKSGIKHLRRLALFGALAVVCTACVSIYRNHGYVPRPDELAQIRVGVDNRESVTKAVGSPGASGVLDASGYYYIASRVRHYGAREPQTVSRELVAITFDGRGLVRNIERYGLEDGRVVPLERRVTDNGESDSTFLRQLLGNLGRIGPGSLIE